MNKPMFPYCTLIVLLLTFILNTFLGNIAYAQELRQERIDSLLAELPRIKNDTGKVNLLERLSREYLNKANYDSALYYTNKAKQLAEKLDYKKGIANAYNQIGTVYLRQDNYSEALKNFTATIKVGDKAATGNAYNNIGNIYIRQGNNPEALKNYFAALKIREEIGDKSEAANSYHNIGNVYWIQNDYSEAMKNHTIALKIRRKTGEQSATAPSYFAIGAIYTDQKKYAAALNNLITALKLYEKRDFKSGIALCYNTIGKVYDAQGNYSRALKNYFVALKQFEEFGSKLRIAQISTSIGYTYFKLNRFAEGRAWLKKGLKLSKEIGTQENIMASYSSLAEVDSAEGNYKGAYENYKMYVLYKDSIFNQENTKKLTQSAMQYEFDKKAVAAKAGQEKKEALAQKELQRQKLLRNGFISGFIVVLGFAGVFLRQRNKTKKEKQRAEKSEKFKQQFLANMSHEIRTPMNAIMGMTHLVLNTPLNQKQQSYLNSISKASENLLHIINEILDLSKIEAGKIELEQIDFSICDLVEQVRQTLQHKATEKNIELITTVDTSVSEILIGDPVRLNQVLMNLTGNAIKFTEKGSVQLHVNKVQEQILFSITDTGIGIPQNKLQSIFESFTQAHSSDTRKYGGTGLGLSISKQLVELMGGNIAIESETGSGTTFSFAIALPLGSKENLLKQHQSEQIDGSTLDGLKILLVDDNADNRIVCRDTLESKANVSITEAVNGKDALEKLSQQEFDIVLMDVQMPVMDGYEATRQIRNSFKDVPVIALTASVIRSDLDKCRAAGMNDYVPKPFKPAQLFEAIAKLTGRKLKFVQQIAPTTNNNIVTASQHIDLAYLKTFCEGNEAKMQKYINIVLDSIPTFIAKLNAAQTENNFEEVASQVHSFKTKFVMMGMEEARLLAAKLEAECGSEKIELSTIKTNTTTLIQIILDAETELKNNISFTA